MWDMGALIATQWAMNGLRYFVAAGLLFLLVWVVFAERFAARRIRPKGPKDRRAQILRELRYSLLTSLIFGLSGFLVFLGIRGGWMPVSQEIGPLWAVAGLIWMIVMHDAWFYWTHRLIHHPRLFAHVHRTHHRSFAPTPFTAYAFDPAEAAINAAFVPLHLAIFPTHPIAASLFMLHMVVRNVMGHCGHELFPRGMARHPLFGQLTGVTHHDLHHETYRYNFGLYFSWWDRWMGTEHPDYHARYDQVAGTGPGGARLGYGAAAAVGLVTVATYAALVGGYTLVFYRLI